MNASRLPSSLKWLFAFVLGALLAACGGGSGSGTGTNSATGTGKVAILLTDGPTTDYDQVNVTITAITLIGNDGNNVQIFSGNTTVNLLDLQDHADLFSVADVPAGVYDKIRLTVTAVQLVKLDPNTGAVLQTITPKLPGGNHIDLNPRSPFIVEGGTSLVLQVDVDAQKSIHVTEAGASGMTIFRPVVFVDIIDGAVSARIAQVHGTVSNINADAQTFRLCGTSVVFHAPRRLTDAERCLTVQVDTDTAFFNSDGTAGAFAGLTENGPASVIGHVRRTADGGIELAARVIYLGDDSNLVRVKGATTAAYDSGTGQFSVDVLRGGGYTPGQTISVGLPAGAVVYARSGLEVTPSDITANLDVRVIGLKNTSGSPNVEAISVIVGTQAAAAETMISGNAGTVDVTHGTFVLVPSTAGNISSDTTVCTGTDTKIYQISGDSSSATDLTGVTSGWAANVYGHQELGGCFDADVVIVFQP